MYEKKYSSLSIVLCAALPAACLSVPAFSAPRYVTSLSAENTLDIVRVPANTDYTRFSGRGRIFALPSYNADAGSNWQVDLRSCDLSRFGVGDRLSDLLQADFDSNTIWPEKLPSGFDPRTIMELGRSPGPGFRSLREIDVTGSGVGIAGIYTVYVGCENFMGLGREPTADPEDYASYKPGQSWASDWHLVAGYFMVPMESRCVAAPNGIPTMCSTGRAE